MEDKQPELKKAETPKRELSDHYKRMKTWYDTKISMATFFGLMAFYNYFAYDGEMGLLGEWYIAFPIIVFMSFGPLSSPEKEYKK